MQFSCNYCGKCFNKGTSLGGHVPRCKYNPSFIPKIKIKKNINVNGVIKNMIQV